MKLTYNPSPEVSSNANISYYTHEKYQAFSLEEAGSFVYPRPISDARLKTVWRLCTHCNINWILFFDVLKKLNVKLQCSAISIAKIRLNCDSKKRVTIEKGILKYRLHKFVRKKKHSSFCDTFYAFLQHVQFATVSCFIIKIVF